MKYLIVDGMFAGTGIRDQYNGGYIAPIELGLSETLSMKISLWLGSYTALHINGHQDFHQIEKLDKEGIEIAQLIHAEIPDTKISYYSDATSKMTYNI